MRPALPLAALNAAVLAVGVLAAGSVTAEVPFVRPGDRVVAATVPEPPAVTAPVVPGPGSAPPSTPPSTPPSAPPSAPAPAPRSVTRTAWAPYAVVGPVTLHLPGDVVEAVGLHQSGHDGAQPQSLLSSGVRAGRLESRERDTNPQGAADIVLDPTREVRAPVTGTVVRAGTYALYCDHVDQYVVVEPDTRPGWEVKVLHFEGLAVGVGDRVEAGVTVIGSRARVLPFASQVDEHTGAPHWPHVHVEVVDTAVTDRPSGGGC